MLELGDRQKQLVLILLAALSAASASVYSILTAIMSFSVLGVVAFSSHIPFRLAHRFLIISVALLATTIWNIAVIGYASSAWPLLIFISLFSFEFLLFKSARVFVVLASTVLVLAMLISHRDAYMTIMLALTAPLVVIMAKHWANQKKAWQSALDEADKKDASTKLFNANEHLQQLSRSIGLWDRHQIESCLICIQVELYQDVYKDKGLKTAEDLMQEVAHVILSRVRKSDLVFRASHESISILAMPCHVAQAQKLKADIEVSCLQYSYTATQITCMSTSVTQASDYKGAEEWAKSASNEVQIINDLQKLNPC